MIKSNTSEKYQYRFVQTKEIVDGIGEVETYGIELISQNESVLITDVSTDLDRITMLVTLLNRNSVSAVHLRDVIDDFLVEF